jgi:predicted HicB family RNase H-like nuclease
MNNEQPTDKKKYPLPFNIRIPDVIKGPLQEEADERGLRLAAVIIQVLEAHVERRKRKKDK